MQRHLIAERIRQYQASGGSADELVLVGIGGHGASGKSTLAGAVAEEVTGSQIVATDEFFNGQLFELDRLLSDVVEVLRSGRVASYKSWDWASGRPIEQRTVVPRGVVIIDGVCALDQRFREFEAVRVWVQTPVEVRLARGIARDGESSRDQWINRWLPGENTYVARDRPIECAHLVVDGTLPF
jgi:uridine kinase